TADDYRLKGKDGGYVRRVEYKDFVDLATLKLSPGDELEYWLEARDACDAPRPNVGTSKHFTVRVAAPKNDPKKKAAEQRKADKDKQDNDAKQDEQRKQEEAARQEENRATEEKNQRAEGADKKDDKGQADQKKDGETQKQAEKLEEALGQKKQDEEKGD